MGWYVPRIEITARLSRHDSRNDKIDNFLYEEMVDKIRDVVEDVVYQRISPTVESDGIDWEEEMVRSEHG